MIKTSRSRDEKDIFFQYLNDIAQYPLLTKEQEKVVLRKVQQGNRAAMDLLVKSNLRFVVNIAQLYRGQGLDVNELINEGNMGLIEAARRFDSNQKIKFISYAVWWVRQNITRAIAEKGRLVRISAEKELILRRFSRHAKESRQLIGGTVAIDPKSLEGLSKYKAADIEKILMMGNKAASLDAPIGEDGEMTLGDTISDESLRTDELALRRTRAEAFSKVLSDNLTSQEKQVVELYYGFKSETDINLKEIAPVVGLSKERVRQLKETALAKLRNNNASALLNEAA
jgi:RNA polymerase sigma factor, sigma-70 family